MAENLPGAQPPSDVHGGPHASGGGYGTSGYGGSGYGASGDGGSGYGEPYPQDSLRARGAGRGLGGRGAEPLVHPRADWNARPPRRPATVLDRAPDQIVVHHTASPNSPDTSLSHAYRLSRDIQRFHMRGRGWDDCGQQLTISRGGHIMEGRNRSLQAIRDGKLVVGAQALHHNSHTIGIENEGTYTSEDPPDPLWSSLVEVCAWLCVRYDLDPSDAIVGHRDLCATDCPGDRFYARLPELRDAVAESLNRQQSGPSDGQQPPDAPPPPESESETESEDTSPEFRRRPR
ncbi:peptidoglycan recognition family protein [Actinomadura gamaensis]|uniref:Peptidoglycan recognition family protein n=1 Tax=Actinomadura gamaensis TaxID=1763541 RepID=A0ABV9TZY1_9ACTN